MDELKFYSVREEKANYLSHALGVIISVAATVALIIKAFNAGNEWGVFAFSVYGFGMLVCMMSSTLYHYVMKPDLKKLLRRFDHASIYILIASSFSPSTLILLKDESFWGWGMFAFVWIFALAGVALNFRKLKKNDHIKTASYVLMGLSVFIAAKPLIRVAIEQDSVSVLYWLAAGGVLYIIGSVIYALAKKEFSHTIFHIFVLLGLVSHIISAFLIPL